MYSREAIELIKNEGTKYNINILIRQNLFTLQSIRSDKNEVHPVDTSRKLI